MTEEKIEKLKKRLGRVFIPDERDKSFLMQDILPRRSAVDPKVYKYWWSNGWWGDQGNTPQCVAYAWVHWLEDGGVTQKNSRTPEIAPFTLYKEAQRNDAWYGEAYEGTSVRGGAKALQTRGYIDSYWWTWDVEQLAYAVLHGAPVVLGTDWYLDMFEPDSSGVVKLSGSYMGGHAYVTNGYNKRTELFRCKNSWGRKWGKKGYFYLHKRDVATLLAASGEACIANEILKP